MDNNFRVSVTAAIDKFDTDLYYKKKRQIEKEKIMASVVVPEIDSKRVRMNLTDLKKRIEEVKKSGGTTVGKTLVDPKDISKIKQVSLEYRTIKGVVRETWELGKKKDGTDRAELEIKNRTLLSENYLLQSEKDRLKVSEEEIKLEKQKLELSQKIETIERRSSISEDRKNDRERSRLEKAEMRLAKQSGSLIDRARLKSAAISGKEVSGRYTEQSMAPALAIRSQMESMLASPPSDPKKLESYNTSLKRLYTELGIAEKGFVRVNKEQMSFADSLKAKMSNLLQYTSAATVLFGALQQLQQGIQYIKDLNKAMTDIQIVSGATSQEVDSMVVGFNELAKEVGATTLEVAEGSLQWYRQGKSAADTALLLRNSMMMSKLAGIESAEATDYMTSIMNGFNLTAEETTEVLDKLTALDNASATSTAELAEAMRRSSSVAQQAGVSFENLAAYVTVASSVTRRSASTIGEAWKTILTRMGDIKAGAFDEEGMDINQVETALRTIDVQLRDSSGTFREFDDVLDDVGKKWDTLTTMEQNYVAAALGGTRQRNILLAVMSNYNEVSKDHISVEGALREQMESNGLASDRYKIYLESLEAAQNKMTVAWQEMWETTVRADWVKSFYEGSAAVLDLVTELGGLQTIVAAIIPLLITYKALQTEIIAQQAIGGASLWMKDAWTWIKNLVPALRVATVAQSGFNAAALMNPYVWIPMAVAGLIILANAIDTPLESIRKFNEEVKDTQDKISSMSSEFKEKRNLALEYEELKKSGVESERLFEIQNKLKEMMPELIGYYDAYGNFIIQDTEALSTLTDATKHQIEVEKELKSLRDEAEKTSLKSSSMLEFLYSETQSAGGRGRGRKTEEDKKRDAENFREALALEKEKFQLLGKEHQNAYIESLASTPELQAVFAKFQKDIENAMMNSFRSGEKEEYGETTTEESLFEYKGFSKTSDDLIKLADGFDALHAAQEEFGSGSTEVYKALQEFLGEGARVSDYLLNDGTVNFEKLREEQTDYLDELVQNIDKLKGVTNAEKNAIRSMVEEIRKSVQTFDVLGYQVSQSTFLEFGDALANEMWSVVEESGNASIMVGNQMLSSAGEIFSYIKMYPDQLIEVIRAFVSISGDGAATFVQQWSQALGALTGAQPMPDMYSTLGIKKPVAGGGGGGGGGGSSSAEADRIQKETQALEDKKKALDDYLDEFRKYIEAQKEALRLQKEELEFTENMLEKNKSLAQIRTEIAILSLDTSEEAKAKRLKLEEDAADLEKEIAKDTEDRKYDLQIEALDKALKDYEDNIQRQKDLLDSKIEKINEEKSAIESVGGSMGGVSDAMQRLGAITAEQGSLMVSKFSEILGLSDANKVKLQEQINEWVNVGVAAEEAYVMAWNYAQMLANMPPFPSGGGSAGAGSAGAPGKAYNTMHSGGFVGDLTSNEEFAKLLKGEYVATENDMNNFMTKVLPTMMGIPSFNTTSSGIEVNMPINVAGSLDKSVIPDIKNIANKVIEEINKSMRERGYIRQSSLSGI